MLLKLTNNDRAEAGANSFAAEHRMSNNFAPTAEYSTEQYWAVPSLTCKAAGKIITRSMADAEAAIGIDAKIKL